MRPAPRPGGHFWLVIASTGLLANLIVWAIGASSPDESRLTALVTHAPPLVVIPPALLILALTWYRRAALASVIACLSGAVAIGPLGGFALPGNQVRTGPTLSAITYNVEKWSHGALQVAAVLNDVRPEVFCLQEAGDYPYVPDNAAQLRAFASALGEYRLVKAGELMIGTRLPVMSQRTTELPVGPSSRALLEVTVTGPSRQPITVLNAHLVYTAYFAISPTGLRDAARARLTQANAISARVKEIDGPVIVCGDFNTSPRSAALQRLTAELRDSWSEQGFGFGLTMNARLPMRRLDYVLVRDLEVKQVSVPAVRASDHRPVLAVLGISAQRAAP